MSELAPTRVLRRTLEEALDTRSASSLLFEALGAWGQRVPRSRDEVLAVVHGALRDAIARRLGDAEAHAIVARIDRALALAYDAADTQERPLDDLAAETSPADSTATFPIEDRAVRVLVVAAGRAFEHRLLVALGERRVAPVTVRSHEGLQHALGTAPPALFVVDAQDFPAIDPVRLLAAAEALPLTTTCVLWGAELPYGRSLLRAIEAQPRPWTTLALREGIDPLLDLVRSRRRSRSA
ncbi:MAG TPA: hypothetical protein VIL20_04875 [Sandaracinaceae bacterium]